MNAVLKYASLVKFAHTVFAMPFAMVGFVCGLRYAPLHNPRWPYIVLVQVILCMVFARNAAMGFNRWADRRIDAENPRTAGREIPAGKIPARHALWFVAVNALLFVATAATINRLAAILSPVALSVILVYSYCKRFTPLAHLVLGLSLGIAPVGAFIAAAGHVVFDGHVVVEPFILALLVMISVVNDPNSQMAFWFSMIPFTSPVVMMARIPYGIPLWEIILSLVILYASFAAMVWFAAKIYRVGIFMYGKKPTFKELYKWMRYKY